MNSKKAKMVRKHMRKEIGQGMEVLQRIIRKKPRFVPKFIWTMFFWPLFKLKDLKFVYKYL